MSSSVRQPPSASPQDAPTADATNVAQPPPALATVSLHDTTLHPLDLVLQPGDPPVIRPAAAEMNADLAAAEADDGGPGGTADPWVVGARGTAGIGTSEMASHPPRDSASSQTATPGEICLQQYIETNSNMITGGSKEENRPEALLGSSLASTGAPVVHPTAPAPEATTGAAAAEGSAYTTAKTSSLAGGAATDPGPPLSRPAVPHPDHPEASPPQVTISRLHIVPMLPNIGPQHQPQLHEQKQHPSALGAAGSPSIPAHAPAPAGPEVFGAPMAAAPAAPLPSLMMQRAPGGEAAGGGSGVNIPRGPTDPDHGWPPAPGAGTDDTGAGGAAGSGGGGVTGAAGGGPTTETVGGAPCRPDTVTSTEQREMLATGAAKTHANTQQQMQQQPDPQQDPEFTFKPLRGGGGGAGGGVSSAGVAPGVGAGPGAGEGVGPAAAAGAGLGAAGLLGSGAGGGERRGSMMSGPGESKWGAAVHDGRGYAELVGIDPSEGPGRRAPDSITEEVPGCTNEAGCTTKRSTTTTSNGLTSSSSTADEGKAHKRPPNVLHALHSLASVLLSPYRARLDVLVRPHVAAAWRLAKGHPLAAAGAAAAAVAVGGCLAVVALLELLLLPLLALPGLAVGFFGAFVAAAVGRLQYGLASSRTRRQHKALGLLYGAGTALPVMAPSHTSAPTAALPAPPLSATSTTPSPTTTTTATATTPAPTDATDAASVTAAAPGVASAASTTNVVDDAGLAALRALYGGALPYWLADARHGERAGWLNALLAGVWPALEAPLRGILGPAIAAQAELTKPPFIKAVGLSDLALGDTPPRVESIRVRPLASAAATAVAVEAVAAAVAEAGAAAGGGKVDAATAAAAAVKGTGAGIDVGAGGAAAPQLVAASVTPPPLAAVREEGLPAAKGGGAAGAVLTGVPGSTVAAVAAMVAVQSSTAGAVAEAPAGPYTTTEPAEEASAAAGGGKGGVGGAKAAEAAGGAGAGAGGGMGGRGVEGVEVELDFEWQGEPTVGLFVEAYLTPGGGTVRLAPRLREVAVAGTLRLVLCPLVPQPPGFGAVLVAMPRAPQVAFAFDLGALGAGVSGALARPLASFLQPLIQDVVATALVWPQRVVIPVLPESALPGPLTDLQLRTRGLVAVRLLRAVGLAQEGTAGVPLPDGEDVQVEVFTRPTVRRISTAATVATAKHLRAATSPTAAAAAAAPPDLGGTDSLVAAPPPSAAASPDAIACCSWTQQDKGGGGGIDGGCLLHVPVQEPASDVLRLRVYDMERFKVQDLLQANVLRGLQHAFSSRTLVATAAVPLAPLCAMGAHVPPSTPTTPTASAQTPILVGPVTGMGSQSVTLDTASYASEASGTTAMGGGAMGSASAGAPGSYLTAWLPLHAPDEDEESLIAAAQQQQQQQGAAGGGVVGEGPAGGAAGVGAGAGGGAAVGGGLREEDLVHRGRVAGVLQAGDGVGAEERGGGGVGARVGAAVRSAGGGGAGMMLGAGGPEGEEKLAWPVPAATTGPLSPSGVAPISTRASDSGTPTSPLASREGPAGPAAAAAAAIASTLPPPPAAMGSGGAILVSLSYHSIDYLSQRMAAWLDAVHAARTADHTAAAAAAVPWPLRGMLLVDVLEARGLLGGEEPTAKRQAAAAAGAVAAVAAGAPPASPRAAVGTAPPYDDSLGDSSESSEEEEEGFESGYSTGGEEGEQPVSEREGAAVGALVGSELPLTFSTPGGAGGAAAAAGTGAGTTAATSAGGAPYAVGAGSRTLEQQQLQQQQQHGGTEGGRRRHRDRSGKGVECDPYVVLTVHKWRNAGSAGGGAGGEEQPQQQAGDSAGERVFRKSGAPVPATASPSWNLHAEVEGVDVAEAEVQLEVFHRRWFRGDRHLGAAVLPLSELLLPPQTLAMQQPQPHGAGGSSAVVWEERAAGCGQGWVRLGGRGAQGGEVRLRLQFLPYLP